ncbi:hypothetical protein KIH27_14845 [Mycobacterium sp. M1]|uniref:Lipoprotein n=1 Tax=Mycolicibacter acidiphilus TaxID=2835306 RepID=A0ABS5RKN9_9MYCO|nr:hypothetical protein [Mycolicibacter acidiphilus]MBS9534868.1 hypothetical protein [Mycolicibacter acidiphilus]
MTAAQREIQLDWLLAGSVAAGGVFAAAMALGACNAHADPPPFPDIDSYAPVNARDHLISYDTPGIVVSGTYFLTPDGISCSITIGAYAGCTGNNFPAVPPAAPTKGGAPHVNTISTGSQIRPVSDDTGTDGTIHNEPIKTLPPFHSISLGGVICGVDDAGTTACKDPQGRGFILSPSWSGWLPRV